ncbi:hypothetical protein RchiOBHm_Chr2g0131301 [Rosa chinensis]|uniref:Uncharacterized protein n=1 Tax=Rosa chinensis TaxID=74649 RepID=A0A2P6RV24_ROSCH|nr:hypothetical protein RchiOBHm_Chr2g0131301 [Rosa chinensis]
MVAWTLVMRTNISAWGYAILHVDMLIRLQPTALQPFFVLQLVIECESDISYLRIF